MKEQNKTGMHVHGGGMGGGLLCLGYSIPTDLMHNGAVHHCHQPKLAQTRLNFFVFRDMQGHISLATPLYASAEALSQSIIVSDLSYAACSRTFATGRI